MLLLEAMSGFTGNPLLSTDIHVSGMEEFPNPKEVLHNSAVLCCSHVVGEPGEGDSPGCEQGDEFVRS